MTHQHLRELAKVGFGLVLADIISVVWLASAGLFPMTLLGVTWTSAMLPEIILFDMGLLILFAHLGWHMKLPVSSPSERTLLFLAGAIFLIVAIAHLVRLTFGLRLILGDFFVPQWISWAGFVVTLYLSYSSFHFAKIRKL